MLPRIYNWLVNHTTGRKWTYIMRDVYHQRPLEWLAIWSLGVSLVANLMVAHSEFLVWVAMGIGALLGHLFWGAKYKKNQEE